ncbi:MAG: hypothetical protein E7211_05385 [Clostridium lundense]|nr:hypothetical protein [Clostridium lundense]
MLKLLLITILLFSVFVVSSIYNLTLEIIIYQLKLDFISIIFFISCYLIMNKLSSNELSIYTKRIVRIFLICGGINAIFVIFQHYFTDVFYNLVGIGNDFTYGMINGLKITTAKGRIRAIGFQFNFLQAGQLMTICIITICENKKRLGLNKYKFICYLSIFISALMFTTYKTGILGILIYCIFKSLRLFTISKRQIFNIELLISQFILFISFIITNTLLLYDIIYNLDPFYAYNSVFLRVVQHKDIISEAQTIKEIILGLGFGKNGTFGLDKYQYGISAKTLDSTFIYLFSNYGILILILFIIITYYLIIKINCLASLDIFGVKYVLLYILTSEFFYNNPIANFPTNIILIFGISIFLVSKNKYKYEYKSKLNEDDTTVLLQCVN